MSHAKDTSQWKAQPMDEIRSVAFDPKEMYTDAVFHFSHQGWYYATFQWLGTDNRWWGWGSVAIGFHRTLAWRSDMRVRAFLEHPFGSKLLYEGTIPAGHTLRTWGDIFRHGADVIGRAEAMRLLETGNIPVYAAAAE